jgi:hypothetical protein
MKKDKIDINICGIEEISADKTINIDGGKNLFHVITEALGYVWGELNDGHFCGTYGARVYED